MEVRRYQPSAVIDVHHVASQKKIRDQRHYSAIRRSNRLSDPTPKVDAEVAAGELAIEQAARTERARYD
jgi:hypothetical protein